MTKRNNIKTPLYMKKHFILTLIAMLVSIASFCAVGPILGTKTVCTGSRTVLSDTSFGGTWTSSNTAVATVGLTSGLVNGLTPGTSTITYTASSGVATTTVTVYATPKPIAGPSTVCVGSTLTLSDSTVGGIWSSDAPSIATIGSTTGMVTGVTPGVDTIRYTTAGGCAAVKSITVAPTPKPILGSKRICTGATTCLSDSVAGGTWSTGNTALAAVGSGTGCVTGISSGTATITYRLATGCQVTAIVTINPTPSAIAGTTTICQSTTSTLSNSTGGGSWSSSNTGVATMGLTSGILTGIATGTATITYTVAATGCFATTVVTITASAKPISGPSTVCVGATITLSDSTSGGTWTSSNSAVANIGLTSGIVTGMALGTTTITYRLGSGCLATKVISVTSLSTSITGPSTVCAGGTITLSNTTTGGVWTSSNSGIATISSGGVVTGVSAGTATIDYSVGGCATSKTITVSGIAPITGASATCVGGTISLSDTTSGGVWASGNSAIATVGSASGIVTGVSAGTVLITYYVTGCLVTKTITIAAGPAAISGPSTVCTGSTITLFDTTSGGTWTSSDPSVATIGLTSGVVTGMSSGTTIITYTLSSGCYVTKTITVAALPASITGPSSVCTGSAITLADATPGGVWSSSNSGIATVGSTGVVTGIATGSANITYTVGGCSVVKTLSVSAVPPITGPSTVCIGSSITLFDSLTGGTWISSDSSKAKVSSSGVVTAFAAGTVTIYYTAGGCSTFKTITISSGTTAISGASSICAGTTTTYTNPTTGGSWSSSNTAIATVNPTSGVVTGVAAGTATITYVVGGCYAYKTITVTATAPITGASALCIGSTIALADATPGGSWLSSSTTTATVSSTGVVTAVSAGLVNIYYTAGGCSSFKTVTVITAPKPITGASLVCIGSTIALTDSTGGGSWVSSNPAIATVSTSGVVTGITSGIINIYYIFGSCGATKTVTVTGVAAITGPGTVCTGSTITLSDATTGGVWSSANTSIAKVSTAGVVTGMSAGVVSISYTSGGCSAVKSITVITTPKAIFGSGTVCTGSTITLSDSTSGGTWLSGNTAIATISTGGVVTGIAPGVVNIYYAIGSCGAFKTITVTGAAPITGPSSVCVGSTITLADITPGGTWKSSNTAVATVTTAGVVRGMAAGVVTISYTVGGCSATKSVTVNLVPGAIVGASTVKVGSTILLTNPTPGGAWASGSPAIATITSGGLVTGVSVGSVNIYYVIGSCSAYKLVTVTAKGAKENNGAATGITETMPESELSIFPNPTSGNINIKWNNQPAHQATMTITDIAGRQVFNTTISIDAISGETPINLGGPKNGIYLVSIKSDYINYNNRLIILE